MSDTVLSLGARLGRLQLATGGAPAVRDPFRDPTFRERFINWFSEAQQAPLLDPCPYQVWAAGRRAAKTTVAEARWLLAPCAAGEESVYVAPTKTKAWAIIQPKAAEFQRHFPELDGLLVEDKARQALIYVPTGARLQCFGLASERDAELLRGTRAPLVFFDELGALHAERLELALDAVTPAMGDFIGQEGSVLVLAGTASRAYGSFVHALFEDCPATARWLEGRKQPARHRWTLRDNPRFAATWEAVYAEECARRGIDQTDAWFRREFLAEFSLDRTAGAFPGAAALEASPLPAPRAPVYGLSVSLLLRSALVQVERAEDGTVLVHQARYLPKAASLVTIARELRAHRAGMVWVAPAGKAVATGLERTAGIGAGVASLREGPELVSQALLLDSLAGAGKLRVAPAASDFLAELQAVVWDDSEQCFHPGQNWRLVEAVLAALEEYSIGTPVLSADTPQKTSEQLQVEAMQRIIDRQRGSRR